jgi:hypothetical protein
VWLLPGPSSAAVTLGAGTVALAAFSAGLWNTGHQPLSFALTLGASALATLALATSERRLPVRRGAREVAMAIVPWGVIVTPDTEPRVLRWPAIRRISVDVSHTMRGGTPTVLSSLVTVETDHEKLAGRTAGAVELERLLVNLEAYSDESSRPIASDLDGTHAVEDSGLEPTAALLLRHARLLCATATGAAALGLPSGGYRSVATRLAGPETVARLRSVLASDADGAFDPRALAAFVAGELDARELVSDLQRLATCPHPMVAACAKAAALRMGAPKNRIGSIDEVASFLFEEDLDLVLRWSDRKV